MASELDFRKWAKFLPDVESYVQGYMGQFDASHDWQHIQRVCALATKICKAETAKGTLHDSRKITLAALLHDLEDYKYASSTSGARPLDKIREIALQHKIPKAFCEDVFTIIRHVSYSHEVKHPEAVQAVLDSHPELAVVQDADRLDAIGAVGIGRCFTFGGAKYPDKSMERAITHFTEKLERLESMMKTGKGREMAHERTRRLKEFRSWWEEEVGIVDEEKI